MTTAAPTPSGTPNTAEPLDPVSGLKKVTFEYDSLSRRIRKTTYTYTAGEWTLDTTTTFVYDGGNVMQETTTTDSGNSTEYAEHNPYRYSTKPYDAETGWS